MLSAKASLKLRPVEAPCFVQTDVGREDDIVALVEKTVGAYGALHIAFNNAGTEGRFGLLTTEQRRSSTIIRSATSTSVACCCR